MSRAPSDRSVRLLFGVCFVLSVIGVMYGSALPLTPRWASWQSAIQSFWDLPWLKLGVYSRADWIANGLVMLPQGFLLCAAADWGRPKRGVLAIVFPLSLVFTVALAVSIEFAQVWFPPRTRSMNDLIAGVLGGWSGAMIWVLVGRFFVGSVLSVCYSKSSRERLSILAMLYAIACFAHAVLPLDIMLRGEEWTRKLEAGRFVLWQEVAATIADRELLKGFVLSAVRGFGLAVLLGSIWNVRNALIAVIAFCMTCELLQIPIFNRVASIPDVIAGVFGGGLGILLSRSSKQLATRLDQYYVWAFAAFAALIAVTGGFLSQADGWAPTADLPARWDSFWSWPFANYYYTTEFAAGSNILAKLFVFSIVGFFVDGAVVRHWKRRRMIGYTMYWVVVGTSALLIEVMQVYLRPQVPDVTDIGIYLSGFAVGHVIHRFFWNVSDVRGATSV